MRRTDANVVSESVLVPLFKAVYGYKTLRNLNHAENGNFPGIDLADDETRTAFQVTATAGTAKIEETLRTFSEHKLYERYQHLIVYILTERQSSYSGRKFQKYIDGRFAFDKDSDIRDFRHVLKAVESLPLEEAQVVLAVLEEHFEETRKPSVQVSTALVATEPLYLNLVEIEFPRTLYLADFAEIVPHAPPPRRGRRPTMTERDCVKIALKNAGLKFAVDWACQSRQIISFHDLGDHTLPLAQVVDQGTAGSYAPEDYYRISDDHERIFKSLLRCCLQQKLYKMGIQWQNKENLFIFVEQDGKAIREERWEGVDTPSRKVVERTMKNNKPEEILQCKHLAFEVEFRRYGTRWFLVVKPEWFFSWDGYRRSGYAADKIDWLKRREWNMQVFNHFKFIVRYINYEPPATLFDGARPVYPFLKLKELMSLSGSPAIDDKEWLAGEEQSRRARAQADEGMLPFPL